MQYIPLEYLRKKYDQIDKKYIYIFLATFIMGFLTHFYMFSNKLVNHDMLQSVFFDHDVIRESIPSGRWSYFLFSWITSGFSMPQVKGIAALLYISISSVLIVKIIKVDNILLGIGVSLIFVTFPSVACCFSYVSGMDGYFLSFFLAILGLYFGDKFIKKDFLMGAFLLALSMGIYQSSITFTIALIFIKLLSDVLSHHIIIKEFIVKVSYYVLYLLVGLSLYYLLLKGVMLITGIELGTYRSINSMASFDLQGIVKGITYSYAYFVAYFFTTYYVYSVWRVIFNFLALLIAILMLVSLYKKKIREKDYSSICTSVLLILLAPIGLNSMPVLMGARVETGVHRIMLFSLVFLYFLYAKLIEINLDLDDFGEVAKKPVIQWLSLLPIIIVIHSGFIICNQAYDRMNARYENIYSYLNRVVARIEETPGWSRDTPIMLANPSTVFNENYKVEIEEYDELKRMMGTDLYPWYNSLELANFMEIYLHFNVKEPTEVQKNAIYKSDEFEQMHVFPAKDSIAMIDGVIVVKLDDE